MGSLASQSSRQNCPKKQDRFVAKSRSVHKGPRKFSDDPTDSVSEC